MAYSKLHSSLVNSSLWCEEDHVRLLFITLLAMCDKDGCVYGSRRGLELAAKIDWDPEEDVNPWEVLMSPDSDSSDKIRAPENEGRRVEEISGGFLLLNFAYYRGLRNDDERADQNRRAQAKHRSKSLSATVSHSQPPSAAVSRRKPPSAAVSHGKPLKAHTEAETDTEAEEVRKEKSKPKKKPAFEAPTVEEVSAYCQERKNAVDANQFVSHYTSNGWKVGRNPMKDWKASVRTWEHSGDRFKVSGNGKPEDNPYEGWKVYGKAKQPQA